MAGVLGIYGLIVAVVINGNIGDLIEGQLKVLADSEVRHEIVLLKALNEWAEGNILEPYKLNGINYYPHEKLKSLKL